MEEAPYERRYEAGDKVKLGIIFEHKATLREVRVVFEHQRDETAPPMMVRGEPTPVSKRGADGSIRSRLDSEIALPRTVVPGTYVLVRISYETGEGRLGHLEGRGLPEAAKAAFEVIGEPADTPFIVGITFADDG